MKTGVVGAREDATGTAAKPSLDAREEPQGGGEARGCGEARGEAREKQVSRLRAVVAIGQVTFLEVIRDRVLYNILVIAVLLIAVSWLAARLSFLSPDRVILDFGLAAVALSGSALTTLIGASLLGREFERRTLYVALARPVSRGVFVVGKFVGLAQVALVNWTLISACYLLLLNFASFEGISAHASFALGAALVLALVQSWVLGSLAIFFSTFTTTSLSVIMTLGVYVVGVNVSQLRLLATRVESGAVAAALELASALLPNFEKFGLGFQVTYGLPVSGTYLGGALAYGFFTCGALLVASGLLVRGREI
jgi:ABC-type transport system involved in multi-copper enzyme maturation permease subunit